MIRPDLEAIRVRAEAARPRPWRNDFASAAAIEDGLRAHPRTDVQELLAYVAEIEAVVREQSRVLRDLTYGGEVCESGPCMYCGGLFREDGRHKGDCRLAAAVRRASALLGGERCI